MPVDRPTFSESWYRVAELRPQLRPSVQINRQYFRGQLWHVVQDPANNQFFRLSESAYQLVAMLDGRRTVADVWKACNEELGDSAPTQGETIQLLGQLYTSNLLSSEVPPDAEGLFTRYKKRIQREVQGYLMNLLFIRLPVLDPDRFLNRWVGVLGWIFGPVGLVLWALLVGMGLYSLTGRFDELWEMAKGIGRYGDAAASQSAEGILSVDNLPYLYCSMVLLKVVHEFAHAFACKRMGQREGTGGEVHIMGIMFLVFTPMPYVDASSMWAFRSKWRRVIVAAAGMMVELAIAAVAAAVWTNTSAGAVVHKVCYNVIFVAGVSTLLFNGNPLLRYDAYYILSDLLEIPNLAQRSKDYIYYLVRKYAWGVKQVRNPAHSAGEKGWMVAYGIGSTIYRVWVCVVILLFVADQLFILGAVLAVAAIIAWVCVPLGKFAHYLATNNELMRVRPRAVGSVGALLLAIMACVGAVPVSDHERIEGFVEPLQIQILHAGVDGRVEEYVPTGEKVQPGGRPLLRTEDEQLRAQYLELQAKRDETDIEKRLAGTKETAAAQALAAKLDYLDFQLKQMAVDLKALSIEAPLSGEWISPHVELMKGVYLRRGDRVGMVADLSGKIVRAVAGQDVAFNDAFKDVEIRIKGRPDPLIHGRIDRILPAGEEELPSAALGYGAGGAMETVASDRRGVQTAERFFEIVISVDDSDASQLMVGQRVVVRLDRPAKPLALQWWRSILQLVQRRFHV